MLSFFGENDKIIREKYYPDYDYKGVIVEVGAATPEFLSNTKHFKSNGWRAIHIEPNPEFVNQHIQSGNEIYQYACCDYDKDDVEFTIFSTNMNIDSKSVSDHSFSSLSLKNEYKEIHSDYLNSFSKKIIKVKCRKLDTLIEEIKIDKIDVLIVDTEGWEIEVMSGLSIIKPNLIVLENLTQNKDYDEYMKKFGYKLDYIQDNLNNFYIKNT